MKKLVLSLLLLTPLISNGQKVMVWKTETPTSMVMIDIQSGSSINDQVFQLVYDDKSTNEIDKYRHMKTDKHKKYLQNIKINII